MSRNYFLCSLDFIDYIQLQCSITCNIKAYFQELIPSYSPPSPVSWPPISPNFPNIWNQPLLWIWSFLNTKRWLGQIFLGRNFLQSLLHNTTSLKLLPKAFTRNKQPKSTICCFPKSWLPITLPSVHALHTSSMQQRFPLQVVPRFTT